MTITLPLRPEQFGELERPLLQTPRIKVTAFRYPSGVEALRLRLPRTELVVLPFRGQQVWRYQVDGEDLTMRTHFDEPAASTVFGETYGGFLLHCGLTGIGAPGPRDTHLHHGELPNAAYSEAQLEIVSGPDADELTVTGQYRLRRSHAIDVVFQPRLTLRSDRTGMEIGVLLRNLRADPFSYSYLCHINWGVGDGGVIAQSMPLDAEHWKLAPHPGQDAVTAEYTAELDRDPAAGDRLDPERSIVPEYCAVLRPEADAEGLAHFLLTRPDGKAASVSFETAELPYAIRWISQTPDEQAAGFCLPSTAHHLGRVAAEADGMMRTVPGHGEVRLRVLADLLDADRARERRAVCAQLAAG
ncbi:MAG: DUF4432 family protein [Propionicimonas sp.]